MFHFSCYLFLCTFGYSIFIFFLKKKRKQNLKKKKKVTKKEIATKKETRNSPIHVWLFYFQNFSFAWFLYILEYNSCMAGD